MEINENLTQDEKELLKVLQRYEDTLNKGDFEGWISIWNDNGIQFPPNTPMKKGKLAIADFMKPGFDNTNMEMKIFEAEVVKIVGTIGVMICTYKLSSTPKSGGKTEIIEPNGKALGIYEKQEDGQWKLINDCFNSNQ